MFKAEQMPDGYRQMPKYKVPKSPNELYSGILINPVDKNSSDTCTVYVIKTTFWTEAYVYVRDHGNLLASGTARSFTWPWKFNRIVTVLKAFENAGIRFVRANGKPFERKESEVMPQIVKEICKMLKLTDEEFIVVRRY